MSKRIHICHIHNVQHDDGGCPGCTEAAMAGSLVDLAMSGWAYQAMKALQPGFVSPSSSRTLLLSDNPTPPSSREDIRRGILRMLADDARRCPTFAAARMRAVTGILEGDPFGRQTWRREVERCRDILHELHVYEEGRGGGRLPRATGRIVDAATQYAIDVYERARSA